MSLRNTDQCSKPWQKIAKIVDRKLDRQTDRVIEWFSLPLLSLTINLRSGESIHDAMHY